MPRRNWMSQADDERRRRAERARRVGLFRYELIQDVIDPALPARQRGRMVRELAAGFPEVSRRTVDAKQGPAIPKRRTIPTPDYNANPFRTVVRCPLIMFARSHWFSKRRLVLVSDTGSEVVDDEESDTYHPTRALSRLRSPLWCAHRDAAFMVPRYSAIFGGSACCDGMRPVVPAHGLLYRFR
jgi:hypothetical protein